MMIHGFEERRDVHRLDQIGIESPIQGFMDVFSHGVGGHGDHREGGEIDTLALVGNRILPEHSNATRGIGIHPDSVVVSTRSSLLVKRDPCR